jgi:hypothetical protein
VTSPGSKRSGLKYIFDRRKLVLATELWMMGIALLPAVFTIGSTLLVRVEDVVLGLHGRMARVSAV